MYKNGEVIKGTVTGLKPYGAFVKMDDDYSGLVHISEFSDGFVKRIEDFVKIGDSIEVQVIEFNEKIKKYNLSIKKAGRPSNSKKEVISLSLGFKTLEDNLPKWVNERVKR